jgi:hypothetical protein
MTLEPLFSIFPSAQEDLMKKHFIVFALVLAACNAGLAVAEAAPAIPWVASYNTPGQINLYGAAGLYGFSGLEASVGAEYIIGEFDIAGLLFDWGVAARAIAGINLFKGFGLDYGAAPMATLHFGTNFGDIWKFEFYIGLGLGLYGTLISGFNYTNHGTFNLGFGTVDGIAWKYNDNLSFIVDYALVGATMSYGVGVELKL